MEVFNREQDDRHKRAACAVWELKLAVVKHFLLTAIELNANAGSGPVDCRKWKQRVIVVQNRVIEPDFMQTKNLYHLPITTQ